MHYCSLYTTVFILHGTDGVKVVQRKEPECITEKWEWSVGGAGDGVIGIHKEKSVSLLCMMINVS